MSGTVKELGGYGYQKGDNAQRLPLKTLHKLDELRWLPGVVRLVSLGGCNGGVEIFVSLRVSVRLVRPDSLVPLGNWLREEAILRHFVWGVARLSGSMMIGPVFFGTRPGIHHVAVSGTKSNDLNRSPVSRFIRLVLKYDRNLDQISISHCPYTPNSVCTPLCGAHARRAWGRFR